MSNVVELPVELLDEMDACACACGSTVGHGGGSGGTTRQKIIRKEKTHVRKYHRTSKGAS